MLIYEFFNKISKKSVFLRFMSVQYLKNVQIEMHIPNMNDYKLAKIVIE